MINNDLDDYIPLEYNDMLGELLIMELLLSFTQYKEVKEKINNIFAQYTFEHYNSAIEKALSAIMNKIDFLQEIEILKN